MKFFLILTIIILNFFVAPTQNINESDNKNSLLKYDYAYVTIEGKGFGKKLKVDVDLGDTEYQIKEGRGYSDILTNKKSYTAILNYLSENG